VHLLVKRILTLSKCTGGGKGTSTGYKGRSNSANAFCFQVKW